MRILGFVLAFFPHHRAAMRTSFNIAPVLVFSGREVRRSQGKHLGKQIARRLIAHPTADTVERSCSALVYLVVALTWSGALTRRHLALATFICNLLFPASLARCADFPLLETVLSPPLLRAAPKT